MQQIFQFGRELAVAAAGQQPLLRVAVFFPQNGVTGALPAVQGRIPETTGVQGAQVRMSGSYSPSRRSSYLVDIAPKLGEALEMIPQEVHSMYQALSTIWQKISGIASARACRKPRVMSDAHPVKCLSQSSREKLERRPFAPQVMRHAHLVYGLCLMAIVVVAGCASPPSEIPEGLAESMVPSTVLADEYRIGVEDRLEVSVWRNPDLSSSVPVRPDGMISVPLIGDVRAGGRTPEEVSKEIESRLSYYMRAPKVAVIVAELNSHEYLSRVRVTGAVRVASSLPYRQGMTILDAVLAAGGTNEFADADLTRMYRRTAAGVEVFDVNLGQILLRGELDSNYELQPGDIITVPERRF